MRPNCWNVGFASIGCSVWGAIYVDLGSTGASQLTAQVGQNETVESFLLSSHSIRTIIYCYCALDAVRLIKPLLRDRSLR
jgi:hypothetical protein